MKRNLSQLVEHEYDVLIVGGGIYGACTAWDAALRGLRVGLVEKGDFGHATSSNSLKIIHGGLRYLQDGNLGLVRDMIRERTIFMRIAPHLVHPLPCLMPTYGYSMRSRPVMRTALLVNDLLSFDRNQLQDPQKHLPAGRSISRTECLRLLPGIEPDGITGGIIWHDCQMHNSERLTLSFLLSAAQQGAALANYVEVTGLLLDSDRVVGVRARDALDGETLEIRATIVVNATGPWAATFLSLLNRQPIGLPFQLSTAMNLVTRQIIPGFAAGVPIRSRKGTTGLAKKDRLLFVAPWRDYSLIGTAHAPYQGCPDNHTVTTRDIDTLLDDINTAIPGAALNLGDVRFILKGLLPKQASNHASTGVRLIREGQVYDHSRLDGTGGLITVVSVKYTSARLLAQRAVDLIFEKLGRNVPRCQTDTTPIHGGRIELFDDFLRQEVTKRPRELTEATVRHLIYNYGSEYSEILRYAGVDPQWHKKVCHSSDVIRAEIIHAVRMEMAKKLSDILVRRTSLGLEGLDEDTTDDTLRVCADIVAPELGWNRQRTEQELRECRELVASCTTRLARDLQ